MRLRSNLPLNGQTRPCGCAPVGGGTYDAPAPAIFAKAGWTELVIPRNRPDSRVFPVAGTSPKNAPGGPLHGPYRFDRANGLSLQAI